MKKIKIGVIGASNHFIKRVVLPMQNIDTIELLAIASRSNEKAQQVAKEFNIQEAYGSYQDLLDNPNIDAVYIPLPNHMHAEWIKKSADAGKHILCEKPLSMSANEAEEVVPYCKNKNVILLEAFMYKYHPQWTTVKDIIRTNNIGSINYIHTSFSYNNPSSSNIRNIKEYGGGGLRDIGCYAISVPRFILDREPQQVIGQINEHETFKTDMLTSAMLDFNSTKATFTVSTNSSAFQKVDIVGSAGHITVHLPFNTYADVPAKITVVSAIGVRDIMIDAADQYGLMLEHFAQLILNPKPAKALINDAINNQKIIDAILKSTHTQKWQSID